MDKIKCGLKLWSSNEELFDQAKELFKKKEIDFIEVYVVPGSTNRVIAKLKGSNIPMVIHATHSSHNFNPGSKDKFEYNLKLFVEIKKVASELNFPKIIIHPEQGDIQQSLACFDKLDYPNILVENMPKKGLQGEELIGYTPQEIKLFLDKGYGFCFDIGHAIKAAYSLKKDLKQFIKEFFKLKP
ncbi:MAG: sugar phosphate isomerase/epimerase [Nanoarchaeota archaeon]|nr:sugar phosphate isomerase/epimerase [Nanoarchaeota archaeon]